MFLTLSMLIASVVYGGSEKDSEQGKGSQVVYRAGSQKSFDGPAEYFTGKVRVEMLFPANETAHYSGAYVTFEPGARTAWHLHPAGQHMIVTSGVGLTGTRDGKVIEFNTGDTIWCPRDIDHWHGATPHAPMTHLVITGDLNGKNVIWKEKVTDEQYVNGYRANHPGNAK
jgi:quercetin dioxygenase-like cupin family protein